MAKANPKKSPKKTVKKMGARKNLKISSFKQGLKYPWINAKKLWYVLWMLVPIFGWFVLGGYVITIVRNIANNNKNGLPEFGGIWNNFMTGLVFFFKAIPLMVVILLINIVPIIGWLVGLLVRIFLYPYLIINLFVKEDFAASFDLKKVWWSVINNMEEYLIAVLKTLGFAVIYGLLSIVLIGIPCYLFGVVYYIAEFYGNHK